MATRIESQRNLVGVQSIAKMRPIKLTLTLTGGRPNTPMNVFFDRLQVNAYCAPVSGDQGDRLITDSSGTLTCYFHVPGGLFNTGTKEIVVTDAPDLAAIDINGSTYGSASAMFSSTGVQQLFQTTTTITEINTVNVQRVIPTVTVTAPAPAPAPARSRAARNNGSGNSRGSDPLAQSFFTFGVKGGCFLTSIELYFRTKDPTIPVQVDVRPLINGYPDSNPSDNENMYKVLSPSQVNVSTNASVSTKFTFDVPIYLEEDADYCFVVFSNSKNYNLFTSRVGEKSFETGKIIFDQPYVGSMFKSENNITWQPEQFDDIKFKLNIARFSTNVNAVVKFKASPNYFGVPSTYFYTTNGSNRVKVTQTVQHGLEVNSRVVIHADAGAVYNGISATNISGTRVVAKVYDEFTFEYVAGGTATSTGVVETGGQVRQIDVDEPGMNYTTVPTVTISGGGGTGAAATAVISKGKIVRIRMTNYGSGYTSTPTVTITGGGGTGAIAVGIIDANLAVLTNKPVNFILSNIPAQAISGTTITAKVTSTQLNYLGGNLNTYQPAEQLNMNISGRTYLNTNSVIASATNESVFMGGNPSMLLEYNMSTSNPNISPFIDYANEPSVIAYANKIRNQYGEDVTSTNSTGGVEAVIVSTGGSGYVDPPTVVFSGGGGSGAAATATVVGGAVSEVTVTSPGTGYTSPPLISFTRTDGSSGTNADAYSTLTPFNSELTPNSGTSTSRYLTKKVVLETPSNGAVLFSEIYSTQETSVDWYIRTSLSGSGVSHTTLEWKKMNCDVERDKSTKPGQVFDYKFYIYGLPEFDTYDLKCVLRSADPANTPVVNNYRVIIVA